MSAALNQRGSFASDPIRNFRFLAHFSHVSAEQPEWLQSAQSAKIGFTSVSGLNISTESIPYREGQNNTTVMQIPGQTTFSPITFQRGVPIGSSQHWDWMRMLFQTANPTLNRRSAKKSFRVNIDIDVLAHPVPYASGPTVDAGTGFGTGTNPFDTSSNDPVVMRFRVFNAWPTSVAYSDLNAGDNALVVEQLTVVHEGFNLIWATMNGDGELVGVTGGSN